MSDSLEATWNALAPDKRKAFAALLKKKGIHVFARLPVATIDRAGRLPLSYAQERMWFLAQLEPDSPAYSIAGAFLVEGPIQPELVQRAVDALVQRHEPLRSAFLESAGHAEQRIVAEARCDVERIDLRDLGSDNARQARLLTLAEQHAARPFDLAQPPLLRITLVQLASERHALLFALHHIIADGWSLELLLEEFSQLYDGLSRDALAALPAPAVQYVDYAAWQREWLSGGELERQLRYWATQLGAEHPALPLPSDKPRVATLALRGATHTFRIDATASAEAQRFAQRENATLFMLLLAVFDSLLYRWTGHSDLRVGVPVTHRPRVEFEALLGLFVNTHVYRTVVRGDEPFRALLARVRETALGAQAHAELPFEKLVEALSPERSLAHNPLFQVMYNHEATAVKRSLATTGELRIAPLMAAERTTQFELVLDTGWDDETGELVATLSYATDLFEHATIEALSARFTRLLRQVVQQPDVRVSELAFLESAERAWLVAAGRPARALPSGGSDFVHVRIAAQARLRPAAIALQGEGDAEVLSYAELELRSNQWAQRLRAHGVGPDVTVGLCSRRSPRMIVGALAVLKAGGAYVALDPSQPRERLREIVVDAQVRVLLAERALPLTAALGVDTCLWLDGDDVGSEPTTAPELALSCRNLAYIVYTSGSTGRPKGVGVEHGALVDALAAVGVEYGMVAEDCALHFASLSFDVGVEQWANPLLHGARLFIRGDELWSAERALEQLREHAVSWLDASPAYLRALAEHALAQGERLPVRACAVGGEALSRESAGVIARALAPAPLINAYGPTEAVITPMTCRLDASSRCTTAYAPIGRVVGSRHGYVLDHDLNLVPIGVPGELYLGGSGLARGYLGQPGWTAERFVADPYAPTPGCRMYRTGDRVRWLADGSLEYLGRADHQIKLRGFRIELGEVEARLLAQAGVREAVVIVDGEGVSARLLAYVVVDSPAADGDVLRAQLRAALPEYMVPARVILLAELPRNASGKLDRKRLPAPDVVQHAHVAPRTETERLLCEVWADVLGIAEVSVTANFFELGGDSIVSIQIVSRARRAGLAISPRDMFQHQTIEALAAVAVPATRTELDQAPARGAAPLTPIQLEFFARKLAAPDHYNQAVLLRCRAPLEVARLERALEQLTQHHDALRMHYRRSAETWVQEYGELTAVGSILWTRRAHDSAEIERLCEAAQRSLSLERGELLRALYIEVADGTSRLLLSVHHLVMDGVSFRVLLEDLERAYAGVALPPKTSAFGAFSRALHEYARSPTLDAELGYWQSTLGGPDAELPLRPVASGVDAHAVTQLELRFDRETTAKLLKQAPAAYRTQIQDLLLTALARAVQAEFGGNAALLELESHGREDLFPGIDLGRTLGWFTSKYPVRLTAHGELAAAIKSVKEQLRAIPTHGLGFGVLACLGSAAQQAALAGYARPKIAFNYLGQFDSVFDAAALFDVAEEAHGAISGPDAEGEYWIDINGQVYGGELSFGFTFSCLAFDAGAMQAFVARYDRELRAVIAHCTASAAFGRTPSDYPLATLSQAQLDSILGDAPGPEELYPLTPMQRGMLFHTLYAPEAGTYVTQLDAAVNGLDAERFLHAWQRALDRHAILRTSFVWRSLPEPLQRVAARMSLVFARVDLRGQPEIAAALAVIKRQEHARGFELEAGPLFRLTLAQLDGGRHHFIWTCHHLLLDGWSTARLLDEVLLTYLGQEPAPPVGRFSSYLRYIAAGNPRDSETYWRARLELLAGPTLLAASLPPVQGSAGEERVAVQLPAEETAQLLAFARSEHVTANSLIQAAWLVLLQRYTAQRAVVFGATVSGRPAELAGAEQMLGLFINTVPVIADPQPEWTVRELIQCVQADNVQAREHEYTPLADIQRWAGLGGRGLFDTLLVFENYPVDKALASSWDGLAFDEVTGHESTNYPLTIAVNLSDRLDIGFAFARTGFARAQVERLGAQLLALLRAFSAKPDARLGNLALLGNPAAQQRATAGGPPLEPFLDRALAPHLQGARREQFAIITDHERFTFSELDQASNRLARRLLRMGVQPDRIVGICMPRCASFLVSALAVWKAGAAYLPLDPRAPADRVRFMLEDAGAMLVLGCDSTREVLPDVHMLCVDRVCLDDESAELPVTVERSPEQLAYVIYTSGSTGMPKGVAVSHAAASMHCHAVAEIYAIRPDDCALHFAAFSFDASVEQWVVPMLGGATVRLGADEAWTPEELDAIMERDRVTIIYPPMSHVLSLAQSLEARGQRRSRLRVCCVGGEAVPRRSVELIRRTLAPQLIVNGYGPTETVVTPLLWAARPELPCDTAYAPIGRVVGDRTAYVLDPELNVLPAAATGELYIGGNGTARGYHGRAPLTAERFVPDPFASEPGARMYRTGDLVRMLHDGSIEYLARADHQVKLRGYRIELGEIEAALLEQPGVAEAHVLVHEQGATKSLVGYVGGAFGRAAEATDSTRAVPTRLLEQLRARLPEHMLPQQLFVLEALPRTRHGKVDRPRLPRPSQQARTYEPPTGEVETLLAELWTEILGAPAVGRHDNFFELGGDSILSILVVSRVRERGYAVTPRQLFTHPTLAGLASVVERAPLATSSRAGVLSPETSSGEVPLTPIQRVFFAGQKDELYHFNLSVLLRSKQALDPALLECALRALVAHHPALRYRYRIAEHAVEQYYEPASEQHGAALVLCEHVAPHEIEAACQRAQRSLDLVQGPLLRALQLVVSDGSQRLLLVVHHLVSDGVSFRFLLEDLQTAYSQLERGEPVVLPASSVLFKTWAERQTAHAASAETAHEVEHWERLLSGVEAALPQDSIPFTPARPASDSCAMTLELATTRALLKLAPAAFDVQVQDVLLAALARALTRWTGWTAHLVELEGHGRDAPFPEIDLTRCVGWFTRMYPLALETAATAAATAQNIKRQREAMPDAGLGYGVLRELAPESLRARMQQLARPRITFNYLGQFDSSFDEDGLLVPAAEASGDEVSAGAAQQSWLQLDAEVYQGRFECTLQYDTRRFANETMRALLEAFRSELEAVAEQARLPATGVTLAFGVPRDAREADDMALKPRQYATSAVVQLASGELAPALFCLHPAGGVVFDYHLLARRIAGRRNVYGVQCRTLIDPSRIDTSMEDMANAYARLILETQPAGPYHLLGWSFGADMAIQTTHVLEQLGHQVAFLGLVDRLVHEDPSAHDDDTDVLHMACDLLAARYPTFTRKELLIEAHRRRKGGEAERDIVRGLVGRVTGASAEAQQGFDLEGLLVMHDVLRNMNRVAEGNVLKPVHVAPHCWWSTDALPVKSEAVRELESGIGQRSAAAFDVPANHLQIVYDDSFIESLDVALRQLEG